MPLTTIQYGSIASSEVMNDNFEYLDDRISTVANNLTSSTSTLSSNIASVNSTLTNSYAALEEDLEQLSTNLEDFQTLVNSRDDAPDYTQGVSISSSAFPYTVECDGYIDVAIAALNGTAILTVNGIKIGHAFSSNPTYYSMLSGQYRVSKGDSVSYTGYAMQWMMFFPLKGES